MENTGTYSDSLLKYGFTTIENIYSNSEIEKIISIIESADTSNPAFRKSEGLFAIRRFLKEIPETKELIFNDNLKRVINELFGDDFFIVKSIYFDKPGQSNWFVAYHQDLTISVDKRTELPGYTSWTVKQDQFAVQPPFEILNSICTIRIHLDDTDVNNGALKVIPGSHKEIKRVENLDLTIEPETICGVKKGGIMIMKPLLFHSSSRTTNNNKRRVIHIELCNKKLTDGLNWAEYSKLKLICKLNH